MKQTKFLLSVFSSLILSACAMTMNVTKVDKENLANVVKTPGVFYMLPKTQLDLSFPINIEIRETVSWEINERKASFDDVVKTCESNLKPTIKVARTKGTKFLTIGTPNVSSKALPDEDQIYFLEARFGNFSDFTHIINFGNLGVIDKIDSTVTNSALVRAKLATEVVGEVIGPLAKFNSKQDIKNEICQNAVRISKSINDQKVKIRKLKLDKAQLFKNFLVTPNTVKSVSLELVKESEKYFNEEIEHAETVLLNSDSYGLAYGKITSIHSYNYVLTIDPKLNQSLEERRWKVTTVEKHPDGTLFIGQPKQVSEDVISDDDIADPEKLVVGLNKEALVNVLLERSPIAKASLSGFPICQSNADSDDECLKKAIKDDRKGYRYRIPASAKIVAKVNGIEVFSQNVPIAQYGAIASLPHKIRGLKANIVPDYDPNFGTLRSVTMGATPFMLDSINEVKDSVKGLKKEEEKPSELETLQSENALLEAQIENNELRQTLGL